MTSSDKISANNLWKLLLVLGLLTYLIFNIHSSFPSRSSSFPETSESLPTNSTPTDLSHLVFGLLGSEHAWQQRRAYIESWWRPNTTHGLLYLDKPPTAELLPWSAASPRYRVSDDLTKLLRQTDARAPVMIRMVHGIMEVMRDQVDNNVRWVVMGDDDSVFFVDNMVELLARYDHREYYYFGGQSEFIMSNFWFSFNQGFGGAGFILSYPLAKALARDMDNCLRRHAQATSADFITMLCIADLGVNVTPLKGLHQIDLRGDISGFLSSHPKFPLLSLHHLDAVDPFFPKMDRFESTRHLMKAAAADHSRLLQQTICHHRRRNWSFSVSWGYSLHIYERIMPRSHLQNPIETFSPWGGDPDAPPPHYMFNTRLPSNDSCEAPHVFYLRKVSNASTGILTTYTRAAARGLPPCGGGRRRSSADFVSEIRVFSPKTKRKEMERCECCDISIRGAKTELKFRECLINEIIA
ncbi:hypothetical protein ACS0TY_005362 [Phlomoides rotata]